MRDGKDLEAVRESLIAMLKSYNREEDFLYEQDLDGDPDIEIERFQTQGMIWGVWRAIQAVEIRQIAMGYRQRRSKYSMSYTHK